MTNSISLEFLLYYHKIRMVMSFCFACSETEMDVRKQPKYITFLTQILLLFKFCPVCKEDDPRIRTREVGTMLEVKTVCQNVLCPKRINVWRSQPYIEGTNIPAGNLLLCFAILVAGGSATKVFMVFSHMGLACLTLCTFFKHQRVSATPDYIYCPWQAASRALGIPPPTLQALKLWKDSNYEAEKPDPPRNQGAYSLL